MFKKRLDVMKVVEVKFYMNLSLINGKEINLEFETLKERQDTLNRLNRSILDNQRINLSSKGIEFQLIWPRQIVFIEIGER